MQCPPGHYGQICPRSSLAIKGVIVLAGVIDSDYQGTIKVVLQNISEVPLPLEKGSKMAQILIKPVHMGNVEEIPKPSLITERGRVDLVQLIKAVPKNNTMVLLNQQK